MSAPVAALYFIGGLSDQAQMRGPEPDRRYLRLRQGKNEITARIATKTITA
jgi:hypothetical protein